MVLYYAFSILTAGESHVRVGGWMEAGKADGGMETAEGGGMALYNK